MATRKKARSGTKSKAISGTKKRRQTPLQSAYNGLKKVKTKNCNGKATVKDVRAKAKVYVDRAVKGGQTRAEATKKANAITNRKCAK
jgi:hypothetical protein